MIEKLTADIVCYPPKRVAPAEAELCQRRNHPPLRFSSLISHAERDPSLSRTSTLTQQGTRFGRLTNYMVAG